MGGRTRVLEHQSLASLREFDINSRHSAVLIYILIGKYCDNTVNDWDIVT